MKSSIQIEKKLKRMLFLPILITTSTSLFSQVSLTGHITDTKNKPLEFVNIALRNDSTEILLGTCSNKDGLFIIKNIPPATYQLTISFIGFLTYNDRVEINSNKGLRNIQLITDDKLLDEVTVIHNLPIIEQKTDRYILNIENSLASSGYNVSELLPLSPGVWVTPDGSISINGISGTSVMVDNRLIRLSGKELSTYLSTIRSETIKNIEIISDPSAEFDAEGLGGIINIKLKKSNIQGWSGYVGNSLTKQNFEGTYPYAGINYKHNNLTFQLNGSGDISKWLLLNDGEVFIHPNKNRFSKTKDTIDDQSFNYSAQIYYDIKNKHSFGFELKGGPWGKDENLHRNTEYFENNALTQLLKTNHQQSQNSNKISIGLNYIWKIDSLGKKFKVIADYKNQYKYDNDSEYQYLTFNPNGDLLLEETQRSRNKHPLMLYSTQIDYFHPTHSNITIQSGIKYSNADITDNMRFEELLKNSWAQVQDRSYYFNYEEHIISGYIQGTKKINNSSLQLGIRNERTSYQTYESKTKKYWSFFPSVFIKHSFGAELHHLMSISYTKRIKRVPYYLLLPNAYYNDKDSKIEGNPNLTPEIIHSLKLSYGYKRHLLSLKYSWNNNKLSKITNIDENDFLTQTYTNNSKENSIRGNIYFPFSVCKWWNIINQLDFFYIRTNTPEKIYRDYNFNAYTRNNFILPNNLQLELVYKYYSPSRFGYTHSEDYHLLSLTIRKKILKNKGSLKLSSRKILYKQKYITHIEGVNSSKTIRSYNNKLFLKLSFTYSFSSGKKVKKKRLEHSNQDEIQRTY